MFGLSAISFAAPWILIALAGLPVLWWLLRITPPAPRRENFPALSFLINLMSKEESAQHTPLWLLVLRLFLCALLIVGLAGPILNPQTRLSQEGPLALVVDNGWASAHNWDTRRNQLLSLVDEAARTTRPIIVLPTAEHAAKVSQLSLLSPTQAKQAINNIAPVPWAPDRNAASQRLSEFLTSDGTGNVEVLWLSDGIDHGSGAQNASLINDLGQVHYLTLDTERAPIAISSLQMSADRFVVQLGRGNSTLEQIGEMVAIGDRGRTLNTAPFEFAVGEKTTQVEIVLPLELRNETQWIKIEGAKTAGSIFLLDERWRRRAVGIVTSKTDIEKPLLSDVFYPERALRPFAELHKGSLRELLGQRQSVLVLADIGNVPADDMEELQSWIEGGGTLVRFAGPRLAATNDPLVPVPLRQGGRALGGALSWNEPQSLAPFDDNSPFRGLSIPADVTVARQVLAEPSIDLNASTWARLHDGTPLVTAAARGDGWIVLFHVTSNAEWSTLPISGLFVEMLQRIVDFSRADTGGNGASAFTENTESLKPFKTLDAFGQLEDPDPTTQPLTSDQRQDWQASPIHPPGLYGAPQQVVAFNLASDELSLRPLTDLPNSIHRLDQTSDHTIVLGPWLLFLAFLLALADAVIMLWLSGKFLELRGKKLVGAKASAAVILLATTLSLGIPTNVSFALTPETERALEATLETRLAYILTSNREIDTISRAGLKGLSDALNYRTAAEPGDPIGIDLERDELAFFPLIYWPVTADQAKLSSEAIEKLNRFMKTGGTIVFDTGDQHRRIPTFSGQETNIPPNSKRLREILRQLDIPPLTQIPEDHVITKSFYLLQDFPGRWVGGQVWIESIETTKTLSNSPNQATSDGVSSVIIGSNDWAAAWALDERGQPLAPLVPGGERQRELALRFGINLVMYSLTGNYKADQVHIPALLERLGQ